MKRTDPRTAAPAPTVDVAALMTKDELYRVAYVPFVVAEVVWDYADTLCNLAIAQRIQATKPLVRAVKELRREYNRYRAPYLSAIDIATETDQMIAFQDELGGFFSRMRLAVIQELHNRHGNLDPDSEMMIAACYMGLTCFRALCKYVAWADALIAARCGETPHSIMPDPVRLLGRLLPQFAGDCPLAVDTPAMNLWRDALVGHIHDIEFTEIKPTNNKD